MNNKKIIKVLSVSFVILFWIWLIISFFDILLNQFQGDCNKFNAWLLLIKLLEFGINIAK